MSRKDRVADGYRSRRGIRDGTLRPSPTVFHGVVLVRPRKPLPPSRCFDWADIVSLSRGLYFEVHAFGLDRNDSIALIVEV